MIFLAALALQLSAAAVLPFFRSRKRGSAVSHLLLVSGLVVGLCGTAAALLALPGRAAEPLPFVHGMFRFDGLALFFLAVIQLAAIPVSIFSYSYLGRYLEKGKSVAGTLVFFIALLLSTQLLVAANHAILFLVCWELMSTSAYLGMIFEREKNEVQTGSFYYIVISHVAMYFLFIFFLLLHHASGSWMFSDFTLPSGSLTALAAVASALIAFGIKAGFMPFHFWLPRAHPIAPSVLSAFLSGVIIKMGIYGLFRTYQFIQPAPYWLGWLVISVSLLTAVFGVWYALAQHDIKRLLAYHSVENIGIIGIGMGIGFLGSAAHSVPVQLLGFGGALVHTLNHAIFKSLLFIGSGVIHQNLGTRNIELMGGLVHRSRYFVMLFLVGSVAICGIPPLNGFISEFIVFNGFFTSAREFGGYYPLLMLLLTVGLAFVGGLAIACFAKLNSIMFLGSPRKEDAPFPVDSCAWVSLGMLALLCVCIGFMPRPVLTIVSSVLSDGLVAAGPSRTLLDIRWDGITFVFAVLAAGTALLYAVRVFVRRRYGHRRSAAWGCGYDRPDARMQYSASSFADELNDISSSVLNYHKKDRSSPSPFSVSGSFESHSDDFVDSRVLVPGFDRLRAFVSRLEVFNYTDLRYYISFILIIITFYGLMAFLWG